MLATLQCTVRHFALQPSATDITAVAAVGHDPQMLWCVLDQEALAEMAHFDAKRLLLPRVMMVSMPHACAAALGLCQTAFGLLQKHHHTAAQPLDHATHAASPCCNTKKLFVTVNRKAAQESCKAPVTVNNPHHK
jgi:hypothetical protein